MRHLGFFRRPAPFLPLLAAMLMVSGCQQASELPPWLGGTKPAPQAQSAPAPVPPPAAAKTAPAAKDAPASVPAPASAEPQVASLPQAVPPSMPAPARTLHQGEVRAALLLPLSGPQAAIGQALSNAAQLALFEIADAKFSLIPLDTKGTAEGAAAAASAAMAQGATIVLGPVFSFEVKAAAPVARDQVVPLLAYTTDRSVAGSGVYALGFLPGPQVARVLAHAHEQGMRRIGVLARSDDYGRAVADAAKEAAAAQGLELVAVDYYDPAATDFTQVVKRFAARKGVTSKGVPGSAYDAVLVPDEGVRLRNIASLLSYFMSEGGAEVPRLLGTLLWDDPKLTQEPALVGGWYPAPPAAGHMAFEQRYAKAFGALPPRLSGLAGIAYDSTALAAALARNGMGDYGSAVLQNPNGFAGVDGIFRLGASGVAERGLTVKEIAPTGAREVGAAPSAFQ
ncbi:putative ABC-type branched-chain amino acid transport systems, periplasmic component [Magnetospirillum sp. XM-1]|uniref:penicillin-binding protein activator n=1 Tax=Magnetospirillum sp. XM-1 TaxID=1663591 RepID=UPI00073E0961|nr:penicillin-binding protein activator [Magnetospirillum sp. XM-1]CUW37871.1 putative ABC-type branched-chain amino acid transport systems, periplasmic component [Magnetospirillum sp. XM-1]